ncbi:MAG TPA: questin oxidase family protein [Polyangiaceae bacterium]|nr:questin oxidase family protein [Polyangiaceae bacterium]
MTTSRRSRHPADTAFDRRGWLVRALAGAAYASFAAAAGAEPGLATGERGDRSKPAPPAKPDLLASLLQRNHELRPDFGGGFANHMSMGLYSLSALGADAAQLERFAEAHWARLEPLPAEPAPAIGAHAWKTRLGQRDAINGYRALFTQAVARHGREATLRQYLPDLLPGIGCAGFHALIRTGYGVRFGDDREIADGLAYWATAFVPLGPLGSIGAERDPRALLESVRATPALAGRDLPGHLITGKMKAAAELPEFQAKVDALAPDDNTLAALAATTVRIYADSDDFTALHAVTGTHAFRLLQPFIAPPELGLRYFWQAVLAAYVSVGAPRVVDPPASDVPDWNESLGRARASLDEHKIKLVDVAHEQGAFYADPLYRRAAARRLGLLRSG